MKRNSTHLVLLSCALLFAGFAADALPYDYSASIECLENPQKAQYDGGIIINPELNNGLDGWMSFGGAKIEQRASVGGNRFIVAHSRRQRHDSSSQKVYLDKDKLYTFSAWIQVSTGNVPITAIFKTAEGFKPAGAVVAESGCWSMLKGGLTVDHSGSADLFFLSNDTSVEIWIDSVSLQPFTKEEWRSHQHRSIEKVRKSSVRLQVVNAQGKPIAGTKISINQNRPGFPFGTAINKNILSNAAYQSWFTSRAFTVTTFEDEMKWYSTESTRGKEDYSVPDAMLQLAKQHGVRVRGHNIFWDDPKYQPGWVTSLSPADLRAAADKRISSIVSRYRGQVIAWDVVNENLHFNFLESKLGGKASAIYFQKANGIDGQAVLFLNDYNTIEDSRDSAATPAKYIQKVKEIRQSYGGAMGIGVEGHFSSVDIPYMRSALDTLAAAAIPIWITELDVAAGPNQASNLEQILREAHGHPAVAGIVIWAAWKPGGCYRMCLTDNNFKNLPTGDVVDKLLGEWRRSTVGTTNTDGFFDTSLFHGDYEVKIDSADPSATNSSFTRQFAVTSMNDGVSEEQIQFVQLSI
ncbi:hypothetical protein Nepgr_004932 [Nepenthes gracilis]|uniref:GH10 domain-containing protein n=1 Tax=Nepenthes gracilis TaxID=150966 RepID=A0AAD3S273_NEPGR|nr:hypothetical protein Nepgr_004932 [Nepenthes gracilis]